MFENVGMPYRAAAAAILEQWREAERWRDASLGTPDAVYWEAEMAKLRKAYLDVVAEAEQAHAARPDDFPEPGPR
jgi:hypothetical protein